MFHNRALNNRINKIQELALRLVYQNKNLSFSESLELGNAVTIHQRKLQALAKEVSKVKNNFSPEIMKKAFSGESELRREKNKNNTLWRPVCQIPRNQNMCHGTSKN